MVFLTLSNLIAKVEARISEVSGPSVQTYSEDTIAGLLQEAYDYVIREAWWDHLMSWQTIALDGTTGKSTSDITCCSDFIDIRAVFTPVSSRPLPTLPRDFNPYMILGNNIAQYLEADLTPNRLFHVWPLTAQGNLYLHGRKSRAADFGPADTLSFDPIALTNYAAWKMTIDDATNPGQVSAFEEAFNKRIKQLKDAYNAKPIQLDPAVNPTMYGWQEFPYG